MIGVLLLAHGSREDKTERTMAFIRAQVQRELDIPLVEEAYLQFRPINLEAGICRLMEQGADDIKVVPYFLFEGVHIKEDIPAELARIQEKYPSLRLTLGATLGADPRLAQVLADRIRELM